MQISIILFAVIWHAVHGFTCTSQGLFSNTDDNTCQTYVFCAELTSGTFVSNVYSCTTGNLFNPDTSNCDPNYVCVSGRAVTTQFITTPTQDGVLCSAQGRFPNNTDTTCSTYYFCFYLTSGQYNIVGYSCPMGSRFDPASQTCSTTYQCGQNTSSSSVTSSSTLTTTSSNECITQGRFPVENDTTCSSYYFCYYLTSGQYYKRNYSCAAGSRFDPSSQTCSTTYVCGGSTEVSTTSVDSTTTSIQCTSQGRFPLDTDLTCTSYYFCFYLSTGRYISYSYTCPSNSRFDPTSQSCSQTYACAASSVVSSSSVTPEPSNLRALTSRCTSQGRFPVTTDTTCRSYYYCYYSTNGSYIEYNYLCPSGSIFDTTTQTCTTTITCQASASTSISASYDSSSESSSTTSTSTTPPFECAAQGRFPVDGDGTCMSYYYCILLPNNSYTYQRYRCPSNTRFNPTTQFCNASYQCPSSTTLTKSVNPSSITIENKMNLTFQCVSSGKFPDLQTRFCQNYYYCFSLPNGILAQQIYSCPIEENFDPNLQACSRNYQCPSEVKTDIDNQYQYKCKTSGKFQVENDPTCQKYYYCISFPHGGFEYQQYSCLEGQAFDPKQQKCSTSYQCPYFKCSSVGKFSAIEDSTCQTYHYCFSLSNGLFGKQLYACSAGEKFDPKLQVCSKTYQCSS